MNKQNKKIIYISSDSNRSGGPTHLLFLTRGLKQKGYDIEVIAPSGWLHKKLKEVGIKSHELDLKPINIFNIRRILSKDPLAILHFQGVRAGQIGVASSFFLPNIKIYTEHNWTKDYRLQTPLREKFQLFTLRVISKNVNKIICVSNSVKTFFQDNNIATGDKLIVLYNGVDFKYLNKSENLKENVVIGTLGSYVKRKGIDTIINALSLLKENVSLIIAAKSGDQKEYLRSLIKQHHLENRVEFMEYIDPDTMDNFWSKINIYVQASHDESFGMALISAMGCGFPSIASDVGAVAEVTSGKALLFEKDNFRQLASKVSLVINNIKDETQKSINDSLYFRDRFSIDQMVTQYDSFYQQVSSQ